MAHIIYWRTDDTDKRIKGCSIEHWQCLHAFTRTWVCTFRFCFFFLLLHRPLSSLFPRNDIDNSTHAQIHTHTHYVYWLDFFVWLLVIESCVERRARGYVANKTTHHYHIHQILTFLPFSYLWCLCVMPGTAPLHASHFWSAQYPIDTKMEYLSKIFMNKRWRKVEEKKEEESKKREKTILNCIVEWHENNMTYK